MPSQAASRPPASAAPPEGSRLPDGRAVLGPRTTARLVDMVRESCGVSMDASKRVLLQTRLDKRLKALGLDDFESYCDYLSTPVGREAELQAFVDSVVTNETSFFREQPHFDYLTAERLDALAAGGKPGSIAVWSAAGSTGQEAYSAAMHLAAANGGRLLSSKWDWSVLCTDISIRALSHARRGVYDHADLDRLPEGYASAFFERTGAASAAGAGTQVRISQPIRERVSFGQINLMHERYQPRRMMDVIFCRNVLIYFDLDVQQQIIAKLCQHLRPGGLLILGHAESARGGKAPLRLLLNTIYERLDD
ncbi:protein-glutamate O-methyltransferase CheR [Fulvimarina endophytica]|uniref:Chemotaxis protein methyltransferase n=1 Tax=Fulvimarina endophytica TaxID=2293836 RepID=A0A371X4J8_9HYPH|nr:protein-glutamate O-methyltransferase CheR [Fulvimarina endophytica]RFC64119.1 protein-glutamate O-methyltransferase CheR [Fulvimarina endophytica]